MAKHDTCRRQDDQNSDWIHALEAFLGAINKISRYFVSDVLEYVDTDRFPISRPGQINQEVNAPRVIQAFDCASSSQLRPGITIHSASGWRFER